MKKIFYGFFILFFFSSVNSFGGECQYLARKFSYDPNEMRVVDLAKLSECVSEFLSAKVSGKSSKYGGYYPPPTLGLPPRERDIESERKEETMPSQKEKETKDKKEE